MKLRQQPLTWSIDIIHMCNLPADIWTICVVDISAFNICKTFKIVRCQYQTHNIPKICTGCLIVLAKNFIFSKKHVPGGMNLYILFECPSGHEYVSLQKQCRYGTASRFTLTTKEKLEIRRRVRAAEAPELVLALTVKSAPLRQPRARVFSHLS